MKKFIYLIILMAVAISCLSKPERLKNISAIDFDPEALRSDMYPAETSKGQTLYLPVYSNIPYQIDTTMFDMSAFVAVHNTDLRSSIYLTSVLYFDQSGRLVDDFLKNIKKEIFPMATENFYIPYEDQSGTGANFLIEWIADTLVNSPLVESVTLCLKPNNTVAILSRGKIMRERK
jgi:hypothetical protein